MGVLVPRSFSSAWARRVCWLVLQIAAESIAALLQSAVVPPSASTTPTPSKKQRKGGGARQGLLSGEPAVPEDWPPPGKRTLVATVLLEMLLWKADMTDRCAHFRMYGDSDGEDDTLVASADRATSCGTGGALPLQPLPF